MQEAGSSQRARGKDAVAELTQMPASFNRQAKAAAEVALPPGFLEVLEISEATENLSREVEAREQLYL